MKINSQVQAPRQPIKERTPTLAEEANKTRAVKPQEKPPEPPKPQGLVGRNLDTQA